MAADAAIDILACFKRISDLTEKLMNIPMERDDARALAIKISEEVAVICKELRRRPT